MNPLLDTHIWLWSQLEPRRLGKRAMAVLSDVDNKLWLSPISVWEALMLMQKGRVQVEHPISWVKDATELLREAPLTNEIVRAAMAMSLLHADPADKFLAATAKVLNLTLMTADQKLLALGEIASIGNT